MRCLKCKAVFEEAVEVYECQHCGNVYDTLNPSEKCSMESALISVECPECESTEIE